MEMADINVEMAEMGCADDLKTCKIMRYGLRRVICLMTMIVKRGDIYYADLSPVVGSEQGGIRPVVIIQNRHW